jgi:hypothetical protein
VLAEGEVRTRDLGGSSSTLEVAKAISDAARDDLAAGEAPAAGLPEPE